MCRLFRGHETRHIAPEYNDWSWANMFEHLSEILARDPDYLDRLINEDKAALDVEMRQLREENDHMRTQLKQQLQDEMKTLMNQFKASLAEQVYLRDGGAQSHANSA